MIRAGASAGRGFDDPSGRRFGGVPTYPWRCAPDGLATARQLRQMGLRPGGQDIAGQVCRRRRRGRVLSAYLFRVELALPKRAATPGQLVALGKALRARQTCPECELWVGYVPPSALGGVCLECSQAPTVAAAA